MSEQTTTTTTPTTTADKPQTIAKDAKTGRFLPGNRGGPGNPHAQAVAKFRAEVLRSVKNKDIRDVVGAVLKQAKKGDVRAAQLFFEIAGCRVKHIEAEVNATTTISVEEARSRVQQFFGEN